MGAVLVYFWPQWRHLLVTAARGPFLRQVCLAIACTGGLGLILRASWQDRSPPGHPLTSKQAVLIGVVQSLCLPFRGFSRSGATISTALLRGISRRDAESFSFALAVGLTPPVLGRELWRLWTAHTRATAEGMAGTLGGSLWHGFLGMVCSAGAGLVALVALSAVLERGRWQYFGYYCVLAAGSVGLGHVRGFI